MSILRAAGATFALAGALALCGGDRGEAGTLARDHSDQESIGGARTPMHAPPPMLDGKPMWADNREHSAMENLDYQFDHWGSALGAHDAKDYAHKARAFIDHPPHPVERVRRPNGDVLMYDKTANILAVVRRDGAPRLFRKPLNGVADWEKAKAEASSGGRSSSRRHLPGSGD